MLDATVMSDLRRAVRDARNRGSFGARVVTDDVFSTAGEIADIATRAATGGEIIPVGQLHTWSIMEPDAPLVTGMTPIAHYHFDETTGSAAADCSLNDNDLTVSGATWAEGKFGNCLSFDGSDDVATVTAVSQEPLRNYLYVSCWVNPSSLTGTRPIVKLADRFVLYFDTGVLKADFIDGETTYTVNSTMIAPTGSWVFVTFQYIDGQILFGLDDLVYRGTIAAVRYAEEYPASGKALTVGSDGSDFFAGLLDELLVDANVRVMDDWPAANPLTSINDVIYWPFMEGTGNSVFDGKLLGTTLTLSGGTWTDGRIRHGVSFDGVSDYADCTPVAESFSGVTLSIQVGIKFGAVAACPIITQDGGLNLAIDGSGNITAALGGVSSPASTLGNLTVDTDDWYNLTLVYDGSWKEIWVNGQKIGQVSATGTATMPAETLYLARDGETYGNCIIDKVRIYRGRLMPYRRTVPLFMAGLHGFAPDQDWVTA